MSDLIITPSSGKIDFIYQSGPVGQEGQTSRLESITIDPTEGLVFSGKISASSVTAPLNVTATSSNINYPFIFASSGTTGAKSLLMDSAGGTYNPSTNLATIDISGTSSWASNAVTSLVCTGNAATATTASYANALNAANNYTVAGITGNLTGNVTGTATTASYANALNAANNYIVTGITGNLTGNVTGTATTASYANALNAANSYTVVGITGNLTGTATTASYANNLNAANQYTVGGITGSLFGTSSWASNAVTSLACTGNAATVTNGLYTNSTLTAGNLSGTIPSAVLGNSTVYIGSTAVPLNRANTAIVLTGITSIDGNAATATTATTASYANNLNAANQYTVGGITGSLFGTSSWATNATNALTATNATQLNGQAASYYTDITARLGYTPVNKIGDTVTGNLIINGNFSVNGSFTAFSASNVYISSSQLYIEDNILTLNAFSPYLRYAGIEMYDSGSGTLSSLLWDGESDYFFLTGSSVNGKIITGPDSQANLSANFVPKATAGYKLGNSIIYDNGTSVGIGTTTVNQKVSIYPGTTGGISLQDIDSETRAYFFIDNTNPTYSTGIRTQNYYLDFDSSGGSQNAIRFYTGTSTIGTGTERMRIISNGNVGIGTNTPGALFEISSSTAASLLNVKGAGGNGLLFVSGSGNVGIGTTSPAAKLYINASGSSINLLRGVTYNDSNASFNNASLEYYDTSTSNASTATKINYNAYFNKRGTANITGYTVGNFNGSTQIDSGSVNLIWDYSSRIEIRNQATASSLVHFVADSGYVTAQGGVLGKATDRIGFFVRSQNQSALTLTNQYGIYIEDLGQSTNNYAFYSNVSAASNKYNIYAAGTANNYFAGYVGIGATSFVYGAANRGLLEVYGSTDALIALRNDTANFYIHKSGNNFAMVNGGAGYMTFNTNGSDRLYIDSNGYIGIATTSILTTGGNAQLSISTNTTAVALSFGASNNDMSYIRRLSAGVYQWQTYNSGNTGQIHLQPYGGSVGIGTTSPSSTLHVNSTTAGATLLRTDGTNGTLFSVVDDLSDSLMSVNNSAGLPVLEVFADDRIVMGQYGQNDFVLVNNKVGIGTNNPANKLTVSGSVSIGSGTYNTSAPTNGLIVEGKVGVGTNSVDSWAQLKVIGTSALGGIVYVTDKIQALSAFPGSATNLQLNTDGGNVGIGTTLPFAKLHVQGNISGSSFTSSISNAVGFLGTSSWATNAVTSLVCTGNAATATTASYANALNAANSYTVVDVNTTGNIRLRNGDPTITLSDTNHSSSFIQVDGNYFSILCGPPNASFGEWVVPANGRWPMEISLTNNTSTFGGSLDAISFIGSGSGLFGTAAGLSIGGTATTATTANALNTGNSYTGVNFTATGFFQTNSGNIKSDTSFTLLTTTNGAQSVSVKGILLGTSYDTAPGANEIRTTNNTSLYLNARGTGDIQFQTADSLKMMLLNNGNVGIGESSPIQKLHVLGNTVFGNFGNNTYKYNLYLSFAAAADESWVRIYLPQNYDSSNNGGTVKVRVLFAANHASFGAHEEYQISYKTFYPSPYLTFSKIICTNKTTDFAVNGTYYPASSTPDVIFYSNADDYLYIKIKGFAGYNTVRFIEAEVFGRTAATPTITTTTAPASSTELVKTIQFLPQEGNIYADGSVGIGTSSPSTKLQVKGVITAGSVDSVSGTTLLVGQYGNGNLTVLGSEYSSGGPVLAYAVSPSTSAAGAFLSSTGIAIPRSAYTQDGGTHRWFTGASQTVDIGSAVSTSEKVRITSAGNVGIGTTSPASNLEVQGITDASLGGIGLQTQLWVSDNRGQAAGVGGGISFAGRYINSNATQVTLGAIRGSKSNDTTTNTVGNLELYAFGGDLKFYSEYGGLIGANTELVTIKANGNVGIGTTSVGSPLEVYGTSMDPSLTPSATSIFNINSLGAELAIGRMVTSPHSIWLQGKHATVTGSLTYPIVLNPLGGFVGIGTTAPAATLHVSGSSGATAIFQGSTQSTMNLKVGSFDNYLVGTSTGDISIRPSGSTAVTILSNGSVGIGTTAPVAKLQVAGNISGSSFTSSISNAVGFLGTSSWATNAVTALNVGNGTITIAGGTGVGVGSSNTFTTNQSGATTVTITNTGVTSAVAGTGVSVTAATGPITFSIGQAVGTAATPTFASVSATTFTGALTGTATTASYANALNPANSYTVTGITGALTGTATTASYANNLNAANQYTVGGITGSHFGTSSWATNATNALQLGGTAAASYVTLADTQSLSNKTLTSPILVTPALGTPSSGNLTSCTFPTLNQNTTGTAATASYANALNAANSYTVTSLTATNEIGTRSTNIGANLERGDATVTTLRFDSDNFRFYSGGTGALGEILRVTEGGLVGIGTSIPSTLLHAYGADGRYFTYSGTSGAFTIQRNAITTGGATPVLSLINTQGMDSSTGRGTSIQLDLGYGGSASVVGTAARGARIATLGETVYDATAANQNAVLAFFTSTAGSLTEKLRIRSDGSLSPITVSSTTAGATLLRTDGTNGTLFSVVDDLSDSLMSVNNSAGLPVLEVFADDRIVAGQYGQNDFVVVNNKVGIGTNNPLAELHVTSSTSIPSAIFMGGNVGIGTTSPNCKLHLSGTDVTELRITSTTGNTNSLLSFYELSLASWGIDAGQANGSFFIKDLFNTRTVLTLNASGNVGIGTTLPTTPLHVNGVISGSSFTGAGTGLTGTAAGLSIGGTAATATTAGSCTGNAAGSSTFVASLGTGINYEPYSGSRTTVTKTNGLSHYTGYSGGTNRPTTYDYTLQVANGSMGWEISMDWISLAGPSIFARSLRDCCQGWSAWVRILDSVNYNYAATMNQNVKTSDSPTFAAVSATTFTGALTGNATTVTNGVYTTGAQSVGGVKSFTSTMNVTGVRETMTTVAAATNVAINLNLGTIFKLTFSSTVSTFTITNTENTNVAAGNSFTLISAPDNSNAKTIAFSFVTNGAAATAVKWATFAGGTTPTATITNGKFDVFSFVYDGVNWYGFTGGLTY